MRGYRYILADEYQDIDDLQYRLVSALAGRKAEEEGRLCILAVGDEDQNIYAWRYTNNRYMERFREDYLASTSYLVDNAPVPVSSKPPTASSAVTRIV